MARINGPYEQETGKKTLPLIISIISASAFIISSMFFIPLFLSVFNPSFLFIFLSDFLLDHNSGVNYSDLLGLILVSGLVFLISFVGLISSLIGLLSSKSKGGVF